MLNDSYSSHMMSCRSLEKVQLSANLEPLHLFSCQFGKSRSLLKHPWRSPWGKNLSHFDPFKGSNLFFPFLNISVDVWQMRSQKYNQIHHQKISRHLHPLLPYHLILRHLLRRYELLPNGHQGIPQSNPRWIKTHHVTKSLPLIYAWKKSKENTRKRISLISSWNSTTKKDLRWILQLLMTTWECMSVSSPWLGKWKTESSSCSNSASPSPNSCSTPLRNYSTVVCSSDVGKILSRRVGY